MKEFDTNTLSIGAGRIERLQSLAVRGLSRMYRPAERIFAFRARRAGNALRLEGVSVRYTAIVMIGLSREPDAQVREVLGGDSLANLGDRLLSPDSLEGQTNLGDSALLYWAARAIEHPRADAALESLTARLQRTDRPETVELAWVLRALAEAENSGNVARLCDEVARRLIRAQDARSALFAHRADSNGAGLRGHVACFADLVYPIQALARYYRTTGEPEALHAANRCAERMCGLLGEDGQWWWHYDVRTGRVVERYPVYAVHQDAMAPMALFELAEAGGDAHLDAIEKGLAWLEHAPELSGGTLIDEAHDVIWRKVARREPRKFVRGAQAAASRIHPALRWPGADVLFPAGVVDDECRPYHLGWLLHAWPRRRTRLGSLEEDTADAVGG